MGNGDEEEGSQEPDWRYNVLRSRRSSAVSRAETAVETIGGDSGNPLTTPLEAIEGGAWESPSALRRTFIEDLDGAGQAVKGKFDGAVGDLEGALANEPDAYIDVTERPDEEWKTTSDGVDNRRGYGYY